jgi:hypothetical protein
MKAHPCAAVLHVRLKRRALCRIVRTRVEEHHDLVSRKEGGVQIAPVGGGVKAEMVFRRHFRKPSLGFPDKADMCRIFLGGIERDYPERWLTGADAGTDKDERRNAHRFERSHGSVTGSGSAR